MRHLKSDVSHRMRRRPSIFTAPWFRLVLGAGGVVILALVLGPPLTGWLRGGQGAPAARVQRSVPRVPRPPEAGGAASPVAAAAPAAPESSSPPSTQPAASHEPSTAAPTPTMPAPTVPAATAPATKTVPTTSAPSADGASGPAKAVFRIQLGAFLDHRNADRLTERLRGEGVEVVTSVIEESRTTYRVLATPGEGESYDGLVRRLRALGFTPELADDAAAVTQPIPLAAAVEASRRLREQGIRVRLEKRPSSAAFRVVRAGAYASAEEAERARVELAGRGYEGIVIRER
jgi:cell division septation protein DedD